ncbi:PD-(D/E)XK nuclease family protein [Candidatus Microgenomates bacterium]|nr:PD-(D/E)XK nuclease family protein [Candidatus Microgenomates bacterium]
MNKYRQRTGNLYNPKSSVPFRISRSRMEGFLKCPRCFYLDRRLGLDQPGMPGWPLNDAVDHLLKNEFDLLRKDGKKHALMEKYRIDAIPFQHSDLPEWRDDRSRYVGACVLHKPTNFEICGIIDDIWINSKGQLHIVDYKSTSTSKEISLDDEFKQGYKKQVEWYQWIFGQKGFDVSDTAYFVFANGLKGDRVFDAKIVFEVQIISHKGNNTWVEPTILEMKDCLNLDNLPDSNHDCEFCLYRKLIGKQE